MIESIELGAVFSIAFFAAMGHCVGMCGGIVIAYSTLFAPAKVSESKVSESSTSESAKLKSHILKSKPDSESSRHSLPQSLFFSLPFHLSYHAGKILTYSTLGFFAGLLGALSQPSPTLKATLLGLVGGGLVLLGLGVLGFGALSQFFAKFFPSFGSLFATFGVILRPLLVKKEAQSPLYIAWRLFVLGLANGLLPCGIVYYFLLSASVAGSGLNGALVMLIFGAASIMPLLLLGLLGSSLHAYFQAKRVIFLRLSGVMMIAFGAWEVYKALPSLAAAISN